MTAPAVTVTVLTWNGEKYLEALLNAVEAQQYDGDVEILAIDSGSTDATLAILAAHPGVRLHTIPNSEFGHGRTRQLAAELATGDYVAYLTHDAVPSHDRWLHELVAPMRDDDRVAAVVGKQEPRPGTPPVLKYDIQRVFRRLGPDYGVTVTWDTGWPVDATERAAAAFYSDANSATRRSLLLGAVPYRDVAYAEDQLFGRDLFDRGYRKAYAPRAVVQHSNDTTFRTFGARITADMIGLRSIGTVIPPVSIGAAFKQFLKWSIADAGGILLDKDFGAGSKIRWLLVNPWFHVVKWRAYRRGSRAPVLPQV